MFNEIIMNELVHDFMDNNGGQRYLRQEPKTKADVYDLAAHNSAILRDMFKGPKV